MTVKVKIVIAEDSPTQAEQLKYLLEQKGYAVVIGRNGAEALELVRAHRPALVISDIIMPEMDGYRLCEAIKQEDGIQETPVILLTSLNGVEDVMSALKCGADNFLRKPYTPDTLVSHIEYILLNRRLRNSRSLQTGLEISVAGQRHFISAERQQIVDLLISTFDEAIRLNGELKQSNVLLNQLHGIASALNRSTTVPQVAEESLGRLLALAQADSGWMTVAKGDAYQVAAARHLAALAGHAPAGACNCHDPLSASATWAHTFRHCRHCHFLGIPLETEQRRLGMIGLYPPPGQSLTADQQAMLQSVARQVAVALERAHLLEDMESRIQQRTEALRAEISQRRQAEATLHRQEEMQRRIFEQAAVGIAYINLDGHIEMANQKYVEITGYSQAELCGLHLNEITWPGDREASLENYRTLLERRRETFSQEKRYIRKDGSVSWGRITVSICTDPASGEVVNFIAVLEDISRRKEQELQLDRLAWYDPLTGLPNRSLFNRRLEETLHARASGQPAHALLFLDLDHFKEINDVFGHGVGDQVLAVIAGRIRSCLATEDLAARLNGDEFMVILGNAASQERLAACADRLMACVTETIVIDGSEIFLTASIGIALCPEHGQSATELLANADLAMFHAKEEGRNNWKVFNHALKAQQAEKLSIKACLRQAMEREEFSLAYQPIVDLDSGRIVSAEALLRWQNPYLGPVSPARVIPIAEETGLIVPLGDWVLRTACRQNRAWQDGGLPPISVAVNLSIRQLYGQDIVAMVRAALADSGLPAEYLQLELTESLIMHRPEEVAKILLELKNLGVRASIDDFGTGYSSLAYLKRLPISTVKLDRSFVKEITSSAEDASIARAVVAMARSMQLSVVAEGVETAGQLGYLHRIGFDKAQGYHFSPPVAAGAMTRLLQERRTWQQGGAQNDSSGNTLLIVDDEANITASLRRALRRDHYHILVAHSAAEGFELLASHPVGVILSDQRMPQMSGTEFLSRVRELYPLTIRMVLSGYTELSSITEAINRGAIYKFLTKPWETEELRETVREAFYRYRQHLAASEAPHPGGKEPARGQC